MMNIGELNSAAPASATGISANDPKYSIMALAMNIDLMNTGQNRFGIMLCLRIRQNAMTIVQAIVERTM